MMAENATQLRRVQLPPSIHVAIHGVFDIAVGQLIMNASAFRIVTTNSINQESNVIDITRLVA